MPLLLVLSKRPWSAIIKSEEQTGSYKSDFEIESVRPSSIVLKDKCWVAGKSPLTYFCVTTKGYLRSSDTSPLWK